MCRFSSEGRRNSSDQTLLEFFTVPTGDATIDADLNYIYQLDWPSTSVGALQTWPSELLVLVNSAMLSPQPQIFLLGPESITLYNTAYGRLLRDHHPEYQGRPVADNKALIANAIVIDRIKTNADSRKTPANENQIPFFFFNNGMLEEVFLSATMVRLPLKMPGYHTTTYDTTNEAIRSQRDRAYALIFQNSMSSMDMSDLHKQMLNGLDACENVVPFAILYGCREQQESTTSDLSQTPGACVYQLEGLVGDFPERPPSEVQFSTEHESARWMSAVADAVTSRSMTVLSSRDNTMPQMFREASLKRDYGDACELAVVLPSSLKAETGVDSVLILGIAPRRRYDKIYETWLQSCNRAFANLVTSAAVEKSRERVRQTELKAAARERDIIDRELFLKKHEAATATSKMRCILKTMESSGIGEFECALSGTISSANPAFYELLEISGQERPFSNANIFDICYHEDRDLLMSQWKSISETSVVSLKFRLGTRPNTARLVQTACMLISDDSGRIWKVTGCLLDISAAKRAEAEALKSAKALTQLRVTEARHLKFMETAPMGIMILDIKKRVTFANDSWLRLTGQSERMTHQPDIQSVILPEDLPSFETNYNVVLKTSKSVQFEVRLKHVLAAPVVGDTREAWVLLTIFPDMADNKVHQIMVAMIDINNIKFAEAIQQERLEEAIVAKKQQERFVDMTSHEIRNPLSAVLQCTESTQQNLTEAEAIISSLQSKHVETPYESSAVQKLVDLMKDISDMNGIVQACSLHQKRITDDILLHSKMEAGLVELCESRVHIDELLSQICGTFTTQAVRAGVTLSVSRDSSFDLESSRIFKADPGRIMQILVNLVANAIKFTKDENHDCSVSVCAGISPTSDIDAFNDLKVVEAMDAEGTTSKSCTDEASYLWFCVRDTGCGIDPEWQEKLFGRFQQASPKTYNRYGGSGLGLYISRKLIAFLGGRIAFKSQPGEGSTFAFYVRAAKFDEPRNYQGTDLSITSNLRSLHSNNENNADLMAAIASKGKPSVLLVEDNLINQKLTKKQLERRGYIVHVADHGVAALDTLRKSNIWTANSKTTSLLSGQLIVDIILMDIEMPIMDGMDCAKAIRVAEAQGELLFHVPIIAVTANARHEQLKLALEAGMDDAVSKPIRTEELIAVMQILLRHQEQQRDIQSDTQ